MAGSGDPPEGTPEGLPGGGEDEYRSVVFDESFVRAARLQEFSAQERMGEHAQAVRRRPAWHPRAGPRHGSLALVLVIAFALAAAIYAGARPYHPPPDQRAEPLRATIVSLAPQGVVPGGEPARLFARSPADQFRSGAAGIAMPPARSTAHFSENQVVAALDTAKDYLVRSALDPDVLTGDAVRPVRLLLDPEQLEQFDRSVTSPADDGRHAATGWLVRFDPRKVALADTAVRVRGTLRVDEAVPDVLEVTADHTFVYAVRPAGTKRAESSLFTVRRQMLFRFDRDDLRMHRAELVSSHVVAGPQSCSAESAGAMRPLLAGQRATQQSPRGTDPYATERVPAALCGTLSRHAQP
ncbi:hypothetical protein ACF1G0_00545 [Streptomyces sp. NPDC013953]|uniref:SCO2583 family membrane protein n=1 Tax=Streptomyces sp. NPDC013953 TaxID=3364868 RepID=UPI0036FE26FD